MAPWRIWGNIGSQIQSSFSNIQFVTWHLKILTTDTRRSTLSPHLKFVFHLVKAYLCTFPWFDKSMVKTPSTKTFPPFLELLFQLFILSSFFNYIYLVFYKVCLFHEQKRRLIRRKLKKERMELQNIANSPGHFSHQTQQYHKASWLSFLLYLLPVHVYCSLNMFEQAPTYPVLHNNLNKRRSMFQIRLAMKKVVANL